MNILLVTTLYPTPEDESRGVRITECLREFCIDWSRTEKVVVAKLANVGLRRLLRCRAGGTAQGGRELLDCGVRVIVVPILRYHNLIVSLMPFRELVRRLGFRPDVILSHMFTASRQGTRLAAVYRCPHVYGIHGSDLLALRARNPFLRRAVRRSMASSRLFAVRSEAILRELSRTASHFAGRMFACPSGVDVGGIRAITTGMRAEGRTSLRFITAASLIGRKHIDDVIRALAGFISQPWAYDVIGDGPAEEELKALACELGVEDRVTFAGRLPRHEAIGRMGASDVFVMVSAPETLGLAYLEAMAAGAVVVGARGWGIDGIVVDGENGFLCEPGDVDGLRTCLARFFDAAWVERLAQIRQRSYETVSRYSREQCSASYLGRLREFMSSGEHNASRSESASG